MTLARAQAGFTLVEIVVAFAILAIASAALYESFALTLRRTQRVIDHQSATSIAQSLLDRAGVEIALADGLLKKGTEGPYAWELAADEVHPSAKDEPQRIPLFDVQVRVGHVTLHKSVLQAER